MEQEVAADSTQVSAAVINSEDAQDTTAVALTSAGDAEPQLSMAETSADPVAVITPAVGKMCFWCTTIQVLQRN